MTKFINLPIKISRTHMFFFFFFLLKTHKFFLFHLMSDVIRWKILSYSSQHKYVIKILKCERNLI